jgi:ribose transport system ATP-binding protein
MTVESANLPTSPPLLRMEGITKRFPGVVALQDVRLHVNRGEVLALMGENGAGKSTLMKILGGAYQPDGGEIAVDGVPLTFASVRDAKRAGIGLIHQELMLAPNLDVAANIFLGNEHRPVGLASPLTRRDAAARASSLLKRVGLGCAPHTPVSSLTVGEMQMVEIAKAIALDARILIMDEPTSSLTAGESEKLFQIIRQLRGEGMAIIYISHRMEEVLALADRVTVLRDGRYVGDIERAVATHEKIVAMMVGRELSAHYFPEKAEKQAAAETVLDVRDLLVPGSPAPVSFTATRGEILGFAGLVGAGRTELMQTLFGVTPAISGSMTLEGVPFDPHKPADAIRRGIYLAPEDRKRHGLVLPMTVAQNTSLPNVRNYARLGFLDRAAERRIAAAEVQRFRVKTPSVFVKTVNLSGGNQQKVVLGKWLAMNPKVLILDEPTRGIDVGAKAEIYRHMAALAAQGITILMVSSEMEEVIGMSDRVVVMRERRIEGILPRAGLTQERIAALMTGEGRGRMAAGERVQTAGER